MVRRRVEALGAIAGCRRWTGRVSDVEAARRFRGVAAGIQGETDGRARRPTAWGGRAAHRTTSIRGSGAPPGWSFKPSPYDFEKLLGDASHVARNLRNYIGHHLRELIRKFNGAPNENPGERFTPRDRVHLMVDLLLAGTGGACARRGRAERLRPRAAARAACSSSPRSTSPRGRRAAASPARRP